MTDSTTPDRTPANALTTPVAAVPIAEPGREPIPYDRTLQVLAAAPMLWLSTTRPTRGPHVRPVLAVVVDGLLYSTSNPRAVKARNLTDDPRSAICARDEEMDVVFEATARRVDDLDVLRQVARAYDEKYGWPVTIENGAYLAPYGAPTAGPPPYHLYSFTPTTVYAFGTTETFAPRSTRFAFAPGRRQAAPTV